MKYALVTGASGAIGAAIAEHLAAAGHYVYVHTNRARDKAEAVVNAITQAGGRAEVIQCDITDAPATSQLLTTLAANTPIQILIHNAGIHDDAPLAGMQESQWQRVIDVSLNGFFHVTKPLLLPMMATRWGRIVSISSITGIMGNKGQTNYAAAKGGLQAATKSLALECASRGITANTVAPGVIASPATEHFTAEQVKQMIPVKRKGTVEEVATLVGFLASEKASYITGQLIAVDGGMV